MKLSEKYINRVKKKSVKENMRERFKQHVRFMELQPSCEIIKGTEACQHIQRLIDELDCHFDNEDHEAWSNTLNEIEQIYIDEVRK